MCLLSVFLRCFCGGVFVECVSVVVFLWWCFLWWCFCGGDTFLSINFDVFSLCVVPVADDNS